MSSVIRVCWNHTSNHLHLRIRFSLYLMTSQCWVSVWYQCLKDPHVPPCSSLPFPFPPSVTGLFTLNCSGLVSQYNWNQFSLRLKICMKGWCGGKKSSVTIINLSILSVSVVLHHVVAESDAQVVYQLEELAGEVTWWWWWRWLLMWFLCDRFGLFFFLSFFPPLTVVQTSLAVTTLENKNAGTETCLFFISNLLEILYLGVTGFARSTPPLVQFLSLFEFLKSEMSSGPSLSAFKFASWLVHPQVSAFTFHRTIGLNLIPFTGEPKRWKTTLLLNRFVALCWTCCFKEIGTFGLQRRDV